MHPTGQDISGGTIFRVATKHPEDVRSFTAIEMGLAGFGLEGLADVTHGGSWHIDSLPLRACRRCSSWADTISSCQAVRRYPPNCPAPWWPRYEEPMAWVQQEFDDCARFVRMLAAAPIPHLRAMTSPTAMWRLSSWMMDTEEWVLDLGKNGTLHPRSIPSAEVMPLMAAVWWPARLTPAVAAATRSATSVA